MLKPAGNLSGKVIVTGSMKANDTDLVVARISSGAEVLARANARNASGAGCLEPAAPPRDRGARTLRCEQ